jgi:hypothetical protein
VNSFDRTPPVRFPLSDEGKVPMRTEWMSHQTDNGILEGCETNVQPERESLSVRDVVYNIPLTEYVQQSQQAI